MSTTDRTTTVEANRIEVVSNEKVGTVTFVADLDTDSDVPPTEWISIAAEDTVDVQESR